MQSQELQQRFSQVESSIRRIADQCNAVQSIPMDLKECIQQLDQHAVQGKQAMQSQDEDQIRQYVESMEELGDRAKEACEQSPAPINDELKDAIMQAHRELSDLKHQLH